jgi:ArsR family transcriptional regulator, arsenate/arsenite/antimonite-responsive transcriptional repressor
MTFIPIEKLIITGTSSSDQSMDMEVALPLLKLMSEPNRLKIFALLAGGERCVCEIEESVKLPQNLVSHHLGVLRDAGYIRARREGRWVYYAVNKEMLSQIYPVICRLFSPECVNDKRAVC